MLSRSDRLQPSKKLKGFGLCPLGFVWKDGVVGCGFDELVLHARDGAHRKVFALSYPTVSGAATEPLAIES